MALGPNSKERFSYCAKSLIKLCIKKDHAIPAANEQMVLPIVLD
jgi:hypothetical protein